jgi:hypothetical protein
MYMKVSYMTGATTTATQEEGVYEHQGANAMEVKNRGYSRFN